MHEGYNELGLFSDWSADWKLKPAYWVYVNFYNLMQDAELLAASYPEGTVVLAGRHPQEQTLAIWIANGTFEPQGNEMILQIKHWPTTKARVTVYNNLKGLQAQDALNVTMQEGRLAFAYSLPPLNSYTFVIQPVP
jgi:hypothetical protein